MAIHNKPDESVFASSARQGEVSNFPDISRGWGVSFDQTGGIPPMEWFNFLFKRTDEKFGYLFQRGLSEWSATQEYPIGALVQYKNLTYKAKRANTNKNPEQADSLDWQRWGFTQSELKNATLTEAGITQLLTSVKSDDEDKSATPKSVKIAYDKGVEAKTAADNANNNANGRVSKSGDTMTGDLTVQNLTSNGDVLTGIGRSLNRAIYREGDVHDIALSWQRDGLKVRVDNVDIGRVAYKSDLNRKVDVGQIDAGNRYIRVQNSLLVISVGTAGGVEQSGSVYNTFPISFPNVCVAVIPVHVGTDQTTNIVIESSSVTKYGFKAKSSHRLNSAIDYIAFGY